MRITPEYIESLVESVEYSYNDTLTIATVTTKSGTKLVGHSACLDPANYDKATGEQIARKNAVEQLWALEGYFIRKLGLHDVPGELSSPGLSLHVHMDTPRPDLDNKWYQHFRTVACYLQPTLEEIGKRAW